MTIVIILILHHQYENVIANVLSNTHCTALTILIELTPCVAHSMSANKNKTEKNRLRRLSINTQSFKHICFHVRSLEIHSNNDGINEINQIKSNQMNTCNHIYHAITTSTFARIHFTLCNFRVKIHSTFDSNMKTVIDECPIFHLYKCSSCSSRSNFNKASVNFTLRSH